MSSGNEIYSVINKTFLVWIIASLWTFAIAFSVETKQPITVNKMKSSKPWVSFSTGYVRCFCNLPQCVSTGYMCKSSAGGCFSNLLENVGQYSKDESKDYRGRHGCLELLENRETEACETEQSLQLNKKTFTFCCYYDMCNHVDSPQTKDLINKTLLRQLHNTTNYNYQTDADGRNVQPVDYINSQVWFRAATIAVPVCGAVILFVLIALAVKILQTENQHSANRKLGTTCCEPSTSSQNKHGCDKIEHSYDNIFEKSRPYKCYHHHRTEDFQKTRIPLLENKNESNIKLKMNSSENCTNFNTSVILDLEKPPSDLSKNNDNLYCVKNNAPKLSDKGFTNSFHL